MEWRDRGMRLLIDPKKDIKDACESGKYFTAFALASSYFEYEANLIFGTCLENKIPLKEIARWSLQIKVGLLFGLNMLDRSTYGKISEIIRIRNKLVHPVSILEKGRMRDIFLRYRLTEEEKFSLSNFNECYSKLMAVHSRTLKEKEKADKR